MELGSRVRVELELRLGVGVGLIVGLGRVKGEQIEGSPEGSDNK